MDHGTLRSKNRASCSKRTSLPIGPTIWIARGRPAVSSPCGTEIAGNPAALASAAQGASADIRAKCLSMSSPSNYARLLEIKKKYDPGGLFFVHHRAGSEEWSADSFTRVASP